MASIHFISSTTTSISVNVTGLDTSYNRMERDVDWYLNGSFYTRGYLDNLVSESGFQTFSGLLAGTKYTIGATIWYGDENQRQSVTLTPLDAWTDDIPNPRPDRYGWIYPKVSGGTFNLTAGEWNGLIDNINAVRVYSSLSTYNFTRAVTGAVFTATMYNQALSAIQALGQGRNISSVSKGDSITAYSLNALVSAINSVT